MIIIPINPSLQNLYGLLILLFDVFSFMLFITGLWLICNGIIKQENKWISGGIFSIIVVLLSVYFANTFLHIKFF